MKVSKARAVLVNAGLILSLTIACCPTRADEPGLPKNVPAGLYYYFKPGDDRPSVYYVPGAGEAGGDPFARPVRPLPVKELEDFPTVPFDALRKYTLTDLQTISEKTRRAKAASRPEPEPEPEPSPEVEPVAPQPDIQLQRSDLTAPTEAPGAGGQSPAQASPQESAAPRAQTGQQWMTGPPQFSQPSAFGNAMMPVAAPPGAYGQTPWNPTTGERLPAAAGPRPGPYFNMPPAQQGPGQAPYFVPPPGAQAGPPLAMVPPSPFQAMPGDSPGPPGTGRIRGVSLEQMEQASQWARQAIKYIHQNKNAEASALLERAAMFDPNPNSSSIHANLALVQARLGNLNRAINEYRAALQYNPNDRLALLGIASAYQSKGDIRQASAWAQNFLQRFPTAPEAADARKMVASLDKAAQDLPSDNPNGPDYFESVTKLGRVRWKPDRLPLKVYIGDGGGTRGYRRSFKKMLTDAFDAWSQASSGRIVWHQVQDKNQADIVCEWTATTERLMESTGAEGGQTGTHVKKNQEGGWDIVAAEINIVTVDMQGKPSTDADMKTCCLHEVGHALGLKGHSNNNTDIMFFSESPTNSQQLTARDVATIQRLYQEYPALTSSGR